MPLRLMWSVTVTSIPGGISGRTDPAALTSTTALPPSRASVSIGTRMALMLPVS